MTNVKIVALSVDGAVCVAGEGDLFAGLSSIEGLEIEAGIMIDVPASECEGEAAGPAYAVYVAEGKFRGSLADLRAAVNVREDVLLEGFEVSVVDPELSNDEKKLLVMDVDSTLICQEVIDELAGHAGRAEAVASVTEQAMRGEIDFEHSLRTRVGVLEGLSEHVVDEVAARIVLTPGATALVEAFLERDYPVAVVSGGFVQVLKPVAQRLNLSYARANVLEIENGVLTGGLLGDIIDGQAKKDALQEWAKEEGVSKDQVIAVGDGANDILMVEAAALGIGFNSKSALAEVADARIEIQRLDAVRHFVGL
ncbi:phosphoserine phosphatase SerB [Rothia sp. ZJ932]|uniref:phosphoserine phosphatase SerB n=1 Tax=Rothia sp. ZJ932 TaxID=2810516 RepID=UPI001968187A|nr:phosphoserine phosphatase SerB [Rothia sp. ZJ932]QRZ60769.1 phosphoserine phosphatase SerB [Rothia sp. ZJ932]